MRVLLVKVAGVRGGFMSYSSRSQLGTPLGVLYLASYIRERRGDSVRVLDLRLAQSQKEQDRVLARAVQEFSPHVTGISALTCDELALTRAARVVKSRAPSVTVVAGGPHASMYPHKTLNDPNVDCIVQGEGEIPFKALLDALEAGDSIADLAGVGGVENGQNFLNEPGPGPKDLDQYPLPAWDLFDPEPYRRTDDRMTLVHNHEPYASVFTSRGCPYGCTYCHGLFGKRFRRRSLENILAELEVLKAKGIEAIEFFDDCVNFDPQHFRRLLEAIVERRFNFKLSFPNGVRSDRLTPGDVQLMRQAGTMNLAVAIESASPRIQRKVKKHLDIQNAARTIDEAVRNRIFTYGFFMLGFPTETREEMERTVAFACKSHLHAAFFFTLSPHPATPLGRELGLSELDVDTGSFNYNRGVASVSNETAETVNAIQRMAYRRFYTTPSRIHRVARDLPCWGRADFFISRFVERTIPWPGRNRWALYD